MANKILRTIYLTPETDARLRELAFSTHQSKGELIRVFIEEGLAKHMQTAQMAAR